MGIQHVFSNAIVDGTNTNIVRPSDWNSVHAYTLQDAVSLAGNTAGVMAGISSGTLYLAGGNNVTLSQNGNSVTISGGDTTQFLTTAQPPGAYLTTAMQSASSSVFAKTGFTTTTIANAVIAGTHNTDGLLLAVPAYLTTAQSPGAYLTTAMASNRGTDFVQATAAFAGTSASGTINSTGISVSIGPYITTGMLSNAVTLSNVRISGGTTSNLLSALTFADGSGVSWGLNAGTLTATVKTDYQTAGAYLTTAMQSASSSVFAKTGFTTTTIAGAVVAGTHDTDGLKLAVPAYLTTAALSGDTTKYAGVGESVGTVTGTDLAMTVNTNGVSILYPAWITTYAAGGGDAIRGIAANGSTASTNTVHFSNSNGISFGFGAAGNSTVLTGSHNAITTGMVSDAGSRFVNTSAGVNLTGSIGVTLASNSVSFSIPAFLTTADLSANSSKYIQEWAFTGNTAGTTSSAQGTRLYFSGGPNITLSGNSNTIVVSAAAAGGASTYTNYFAPYLLRDLTATTTGSLSNLQMMVFTLPMAISFGQIDMIVSASVANTGVVGTWSVRLTGTSTINYEANYTLGGTNFVDLFLFSRGSGGYSSEMETFASTRNSFITHQSVTFAATVQRSAAGSTGSMSARQSHSMLVSYPMITSGTMTSVNAASTFTTWGTGYTTWNSTASTSVSNTYNTTTTGSTSIASTHPGTTAWSSNKMVPMHFASALAPGQYWLGMVRYSSTSSNSASAQTNAAAGTGASYTVTFGASGLTRTGQLTFAGDTNTIASSLGWIGFASQATMGPAPGMGSFSGTWASNTTYLNNAGNPAGAVAFSQVNTEVSFFRTWVQFASNRI